MALKIHAAPAAEPVATAEAKSHLRVDITADDTLIDAYVKAGREWVENFCNRALITQTWKYYLDEFPAEDHIDIPLPPLQSITSITYTDINGTVATMSASDYIADTASEPGRVVLGYGKSWPSDSLYPSNPICITFVAGYGAAGAAVPESLRTAIKLITGDLYENREASVATGNVQVVPFGVEFLCWPYRIKGEW